MLARRFLHLREDKVWQPMPLCVMWNLWYERNKWVFNDFERPTFIIKEHILKSLYKWMCAQDNILSMSLVDFPSFSTFVVCIL